MDRGIWGDPSTGTGGPGALPDPVPPQAQERRVAELQRELAALGEPEAEGAMADLAPYHRAVQGLRQARAQHQRGKGAAGPL